MAASPRQDSHLVLRPTGSIQNEIQPATADVRALTLKETSGQTAPVVVAQDSSANKIFQVPPGAVAEGFNRQAFTSSAGGITTPAHSSILRVDPIGNLLLGPNKLIKDGSQQSLVGWYANGSAPDFAYDQFGRRAYMRSLILTEVGDPVDLVLSRFGPDNSYPDGTGTVAGLAGLQNNANLGTLRWQGGVTPFGGTPNVTGGSSKQTTSAQISAKAAEDFRQTSSGSTYATGAHLLFSLCPVGGQVVSDVLRINANGHLEFGASFTPNLYASDNGHLKTDGAIVIGNGAGGLTLGTDCLITRDGPNVIRTNNDVLFGGTLRHSGAQFAVLGHTPVGQQSVAAAATDPASTQTLVNSLRDLVRAFGFAA